MPNETTATPPTTPSHGLTNGTNGWPGTDLVVAQYNSLRGEIHGHQRDEASVITAALTVMGAVVTIAAWQNLAGLIAIVPLFLWLTWRKIVTGSANTFRIASFLKANYETKPSEGAVCWEHAVEIFRLHRGPLEQRLAWRRTNSKIIWALLGCAIVAATIVACKCEFDIQEQIARHQGEFAAIQRDLNKPVAKDSVASPSVGTFTPKSLGEVLDEAKEIRDSAVFAANGRRVLNWTGFMVVVLFSGVVVKSTRDGSQNIGNKNWITDADERMQGIRIGSKTKNNAPSNEE